MGVALTLVHVTDTNPLRVSYIALYKVLIHSNYR